MTRKLALVAGVLLSSIVSAYGSELWLPVLATENNVTKGIAKFKALGGNNAGIGLISGDDCSNLSKGYILVVAGQKKDRKDAQANLTEWKARGVSDAYIKKCVVVQNSRLDFNINLVDDSIYNRPDTIVNWDYDDAISYTKKLNDSIVAVVQPTYQTDVEDIREGLRIKVAAVWTKTRQIVELSGDCIDPEFSVKANIIAVSCVKATMAEHLLHAITLYDRPNKKPLLTIDRCKSPRLVKEHTMRCEQEVLNKDGKLSTSPVEFLF